MDRYIQQLTLDWQGMALTVTFERNWLGTDHCHIEVRSPPEHCTGGDRLTMIRRPLPITGTGYRSIFASPEAVDEAGGPLPFVAAMLDDGAERTGWKQAEAKRRQLTLF